MSKVTRNEFMIALYVSEPNQFKEKFEIQLCSGTYLWISDDTLIYNKNYDNIFDRGIDFEELTETMSIELYPIDLIKAQLEGARDEIQTCEVCYQVWKDGVGEVKCFESDEAALEYCAGYKYERIGEV